MSCLACNNITLLSNANTNCAPTRREKTLSRIAFFPCNTSLPSTIKGNIEPLFSDGTIVASMPLANIEVEDPTITEVLMDDCSPQQKVIDNRNMNFEDRYGVSKTSGSPAVTDTYWDYKFWKDKLEKQTALSYMLIFCNGDVVIPRNKNGTLMVATLFVHIAWQKPQTPGGTAIEYKKGSITFAGDPFNFDSLEPAFNLVEEGIVI